LTVEYLGGYDGASLIDLEQSPAQSHFMRRQRSDLSDNFKISCSPEAESYFRRKAEALYDRACRGELDVEVGHAGNVGEEGEGLSVLPVFTSKEFVEDEEVEVTDLSVAPALEVKPVPLPRTLLKRSSYESLYDAAKLEGVVSAEASCSRGADIVYGDRFTGTYDKPKAASSFEKLYCQTSDSNLPSDDVIWSGQILLEDSVTIGDLVEDGSAEIGP
jgi:hypothetical protein